jgi:predicted phosphodiesterase
MRYAIISDIHGNLEALEAAIDALSREKIDKYLCVGDIVGYGADPRECIKKTRALGPITVCGNHDAACVGLLDAMRFTKAARSAILWTQKKLGREDIAFLKGLDLVFKNNHFILVHGTLPEPQEFRYMLDKDTAEETFDVMDMRICFVGHSHVPGIFSYKNKRVDYFYKEKARLSGEEKVIVNVGSVGQPRDGDPRLSYCVYDSDEDSLALRRVTYDIEKAQKKILKAGLPPLLAHRLKMGM